MNTKKMDQERISELVDGELASSYMQVTFASLNSKEGQAEWDIYHQIGDILRSDDMAISMSPDFAASFAARLEAEPVILSPFGSQEASAEKNPSAANFASNRFAAAVSKRFSLQGAAVAVTIAVFAFISAPQLMMAIKGTPENAHVSTNLAVAKSEPVIVSVQQQEGTVLRDPQIDQYLQAHQRFAPSAYSISQYARPATFDTDTNK
jgi:sigma-E factor negative regulatory protein RseA